MAPGKRVAGSEASRVAAVYGLGGLIPTYDQFVQLYLNSDSALHRLTFHRTLANAVADPRNRLQLPDEWITATTEDPSEVRSWRMWDTKRHAEN